MINFIICEDEPELLKEYKYQIDRFMMKYDIDYKTHMFTSYDNKWEKSVRKIKGFKVYLLDIKTANGSGINAARQIREEYDDWVSMIIMISGYAEYKYEALGKRLMLVDFINKLDHSEQKLQDALLICLKHYDNKYKSLRYTYKNIAYNVEFRSIIKIEKEMDSKRCIIHAEEGDYPIKGTLNEVLQKLDKRFFKCNRSIAINVEQVQYYNLGKNVAVLKNGEEFKDVSRNKKKEMFNHVRGVG
ncbi:MAG: LytTR family transcriptional regulator DNA-binding domain-containing protein [bacterium]|nr:LytTR family transcriptional regulator DNA-binding domain-containing protein [bacterium]